MNIKNNKLIFVFLTIILLFLLLIKNYYKQNEFLWEKYDETTKDNPIGYLYDINEKSDNSNYFLVTDTLIESNLLDNNNFKLQYLGESKIFDPKTCAKMPTQISSLGVLYILEYFYNGKTTEKELLKFDKNNPQKGLQKINLNNYNISGGLYLKNDKVYFLSIKNRKFFINELIENKDKLIIQEKYLFTLKKDENYIVLENEKYNPIIKLNINYKERRNYEIELDSQNLISYNEVENKIVEVNSIDTRILRNNKIHYVNLNNQLENGILEGNNEKVFIENNKNIYSYLINSY